MKKLFFTLLLTLTILPAIGQTTTYYSTDGSNRITEEKLEEMKLELKNRFTEALNKEMFVYAVEKEREIIGDSLIIQVTFDISNKDSAPKKDPLTQLIGQTLKDNPMLLNGKPTLVNFWFTACPPCIDEMPVLNSIAEQYAEDYNFVAITYESQEKVDAFLEKHEFNFEHFTGAQAFIDQIGISAYPKNVILDARGTVKQVLGGIAYISNADDSEEMELKMGDGEDLIRALESLK